MWPICSWTSAHTPRLDTMSLLTRWEGTPCRRLKWNCFLRLSQAPLVSLKKSCFKRNNYFIKSCNCYRPVKLCTDWTEVTLLVATHLYWPRYWWPGLTFQIWSDNLCGERRVMVMLGWLVSKIWGSLYHVSWVVVVLITLHKRQTSSQDLVTVHVSWILTTGGSAKQRRIRLIWNTQCLKTVWFHRIFKKPEKGHLILIKSLHLGKSNTQYFAFDFIICSFDFFIIKLYLVLPITINVVLQTDLWPKLLSAIQL